MTDSATVASLVREAQNAMWAAEQAIRRAAGISGVTSKNVKRLTLAIGSAQSAVEWLNEVET